MHADNLHIIDVVFYTIDKLAICDHDLIIIPVCDIRINITTSESYGALELPHHAHV